MKTHVLAIDKDGSMEHQSHVMLELLGAIFSKQGVVLKVFDTSRKADKYNVIINYEMELNPANGNGEAS